MTCNDKKCWNVKFKDEKQVLERVLQTEWKKTKM